MVIEQSMAWVDAYYNISKKILATHKSGGDGDLLRLYWMTEQKQWCFQGLVNGLKDKSCKVFNHIFSGSIEHAQKVLKDGLYSLSPFLLIGLYNDTYYRAESEKNIETVNKEWKNCICFLSRDSVDKLQECVPQSHVYLSQKRWPWFLNEKLAEKTIVESSWTLFEESLNNPPEKISKDVILAFNNLLKIPDFGLAALTGALYDSSPRLWLPIDDPTRKAIKENKTQYSSFDEYMTVFKKFNKCHEQENWKDEPIFGIYHKIKTDDSVKTSNSSTQKTGEKNMNMSNETDSLIAKLKANGQLILTGAPGTGKTYKAKEIAATLLQCTQEDLKSNPQYAFVQFHPGYDYSDFVEGLKPQPCGTGITFKRTPGIFKRFCTTSTAMLDFDTAYQLFYDRVKREEIVEITQRTGKPINIFTKKDANDGFKIQTKESGEEYDVSYNRLEKLQKSFPSASTISETKNIDKAVRDAIGGCHTSGFIAVLSAIYKVQNSCSQIPYVFVIDEINRADLSRVFGELFSGLEIEYRGTPIRTQYSYLKKDGEADFTIPENVYIIGTMNDIDRSVESMDFALRRRFAWHEITAKDSVSILDQCISQQKIRECAKAKMEAVNRYIGPWDEDDAEVLKLDEKTTTSLNLGREYQLGGAYFKKISKYKKENGEPDWDALWSNHIEVILREYLRGRKDAEKILKALHGEYNKAGSPASEPNSEQPAADQHE